MAEITAKTAQPQDYAQAQAQYEAQQAKSRVATVDTVQAGVGQAETVATPSEQPQAQTNAEWLKNNPPPDINVAPREYAEWLKSKPNPTRAEVAEAALLEKFNYNLQGVTPMHIEQAFGPSLKEVSELKASDPELAKLSTAQIQQRVGLERMDRAGVLESAGHARIPHEFQGVDVAGKPMTVKVDADTYWDITNQSPADRLLGLIRIGALPEGTQLITDVKAFNRQFGTNISPDAPYALPEMVNYVNKAVRIEGGGRVLARYVDTKTGSLSPDAFIAAQDNKAIMRALENVGYIKDGKVSGTSMTVKEYTGAVREQQKFIDENIKTDDYLRGILLNKGAEAAIDAYNKRQQDLAGLSFRQWYKSLPDDLKKNYDEAMSKRGETGSTQEEIIQSINARSGLQADIWESQHKKLADDQYVSLDQWNKLPVKYQIIGLKQGYDAMASAFKADQARYDKLMSDLSEFAVYAGEKRPDFLQGYDLPAALRSGISPAELREIFPPETVKTAQKINRDIERAAKGEQLYQAGSREWYNKRTGEVISQEELNRRFPKGYEYGLEEYVRNQPALILPADPEWQRLKDLPKDNPERQAYLRRWQDKVIDAVTLASFVTLPTTMGGIGTVGKLLTVPKVGSLALRTVGAIFNPVTRTAVQLAKLANLWSIPVGASRIVDEINTSKMQGDWQEFNASPKSTKDEWASKAGYPADFDKLTDGQKAVVLLNYSPPQGTTRDKWLGTVGEKIGELTSYAEKGANWLQKHAPAPISVPVTFLEGAGVGVLEGLGYVASIPMVAGSLITSVPAGTAVAFGVQTVKGMAEFFTNVLPDAVRSNPALATGRITGLFILSPSALLKLSKSGLARFSPRYVPERAMGIEFTTVRIRFNQVGEFLKLPRDQRMRITERVISELLSGKDVVTIRGLTARIEIKNVPYQKVIGNTLWNFSDRPLSSGSKLYTTPQAAIEFGIRTAGGKPIKKAILNEIRVPDNFQPKMEKLLGGGKAELENIFGKNVQYDPIPGWTGKGMSANVYTGSYPIRRFTILGTETAVTKLTPAKLATIRWEAFKAAMGDLIRGWSGRREALRGMVRVDVDPRVRRLSTAITRLKTEKPYVAITDNVKTQRSSIPNPSGRGELKTRTKIVPYNQAGDAVFLGLDRSAPSYEFMGGSANPKEILTQAGRWRDFTKTTDPLGWGEAARSQVIGESNMRMPADELIGIYLGKVNDNALRGARIYRGKVLNAPDIVAAWNKYQRYKFGYTIPELKAGVWLFKDGTVRGVAGLKTSAAEAVRLFNELGVNPATRDILDYVAKKDGFKVSDVKTDTSNGWLLKQRDKGFVNRSLTGRELTADQIASINKAEAKFLQRRRLDLAKGVDPSITDYITAEGEIRTLSELLHGRRKAISIKLEPGGRERVSRMVERLLRNTDDKWATRAKGLMEKGDWEGALRALREDIPRSKGALQKLIRKGGIERVIKELEKKADDAMVRVMEREGREIYRPELFARRYANWLSRYATAAVSNRPMLAVRSEELLAKPELERVAIEAEAFERPAVAPIEPTRITRTGLEVEPTPTVVGGIREETPPPPVKETPPRETTPAPPPTDRVPPSTPPPAEETPPRKPPPPLPPPPPPSPPSPPREPPPRKPPPTPPPPTRVPPSTPGEPPPSPTTIIRPRTEATEVRQKIPDGSITFAWGKVVRGSGVNRHKVPVWRYVPPPWTQAKPETLYAPPIGAKNIDSSDPNTTIQMIGQAGAPVPETIAIDLGVTDAFISGGGQSISFGGRGLETNVGEGIPKNTQGMTVRGGGEGISRPAIRKVKKKPIRVKQQTVTRGINRPEITRRTEELTGDFDYEALDELGAVGTFGDEDPNWLRNSRSKKKPVNRNKQRKSKPVRGRKDNIAMLGGIRL